MIKDAVDVVVEDAIVEDAVDAVVKDGIIRSNVSSSFSCFSAYS